MSEIHLTEKMIRNAEIRGNNVEDRQGHHTDVQDQIISDQRGCPTLLNLNFP